MAGLNLFTNNAGTTLATGINSSVTSLTVAAATGGLFPNPTAGQYFYCTLSNAAGTTIEIVKVTARSTDTFTIVRGQDNTTAASFSAGDKVELRLTNSDLINFPQLDSTNTFALAQTFTSGVVLTVDLPVTDGGTGASDASTARTNLSAAKSGANSDITSITGLTTPLTVAQGGTGAATAPGANANLQTYTTTATAAGTTTLTNTSTYYQYFTGTTTQTIVLPVTSTLSLGWSFHIVNNSTGNLTLQSSGLNTITTILPNTTAHVTCILTSGTTAASWDYGFTDFNTSVPVALGGTGLTTLTANNVILGAGTSTPTFVAPGTNGNVLTSNGTTWTSAAAAGGGVTSLNGQTGAVVNTTQYAIGSYVMGRPQDGTNYNNSTIAGSSLYAASGSAYYQTTGEGAGWNNPGTFLGSVVTLVNTGSWRCVSQAFGGIYAGWGYYQGYTGLWVRYA